LPCFVGSQFDKSALVQTIQLKTRYPFDYHRPTSSNIIMNDVMNHAIPAIGAAVGLFALGVCNDQLPGLLGQDWLGFQSAHLAAVAATLWLMPNDAVSQPKNVIGGHLVVGATGWLVAQSGMFGDMAGTAAFILAMIGMGKFCSMLT
jgi:CBS-domain-containing membrane protein